MKNLFGNITSFTYSKKDQKKDYIRGNISYFLAISPQEKTLDEIIKYCKSDKLYKNITNKEIEKQLKYLMQRGHEVSMISSGLMPDKRGAFWLDGKSVSRTAEHYILKIYKDKENHYTLKKFLNVPINKEKSNSGNIKTDWNKILKR